MAKARDRSVININALPYTVIAFQELVHPASITKVKYDRHHDIIEGLGCGNAGPLKECSARSNGLHHAPYKRDHAV